MKKNIKIQEEKEVKIEEIKTDIQKEKASLGQMIHVWILHHGYLDLSTREEIIADFYNKVTK